MTAPALLVDYGGVISLPQPLEAIGEMRGLVAVEEPTFSERYWAHRPAHDRGVDARAYWSAVAGRPLDAQLIDRLVAIDVASWSHLNGATLATLRQAHGQGVSLSILSNAPHEMADVLRAHPALVIFEQLIFSSDIGIVKPNPGVFAAALERLARDPDDVLFIDDRPDNVDAARTAGMRGLLFTSADRLRAELATLGR